MNRLKTFLAVFCVALVLMPVLMALTMLLFIGLQHGIEHITHLEQPFPMVITGLILISAIVGLQVASAD